MSTNRQGSFARRYLGYPLEQGILDAFGTELLIFPMLNFLFMIWLVLEIETTNVKALYRRAQAYRHLADLDLAELDLKKALEIDPNNRDVKLEYKALKETMKEFNKKDAKFYGNTFQLDFNSLLC